jgi:hypothetical protein
MSRVFVSYTAYDFRTVEAIITHAEPLARDLSFFRASDPDSLIPGTKWRERLLLEMDRADLAVFFVSPESMERPWPNFELGYIEKSTGTSVICVAIGAPRIEKSSAPIVAHHVLPLNDEPTVAAAELVKFIRGFIPVERPNKRRNTIQVGSKVFPLGLGWERYEYRGKKRTEIHKGKIGIAFGSSYENDGFRFPASEDSMQAPWEFLTVAANPDIDVSVYFITEMTDGTLVKLYVDSRQEFVGFGIPEDEFHIAVPRKRRLRNLVVNTRSFLSRIEKEPRIVRGLRVRGPSDLAHIGMFESRESVPDRFWRGSMEIGLP